MDSVSQYAQSVMQQKDFVEDLDSFAKYGDFCGFDYWDAYGESIDLNFCANVYGTDILCVAYPVHNGIPNYDKEYMVRVPMTTTSFQETAK